MTLPFAYVPDTEEFWISEDTVPLRFIGRIEAAR